MKNILVALLALTLAGRAGARAAGGGLTGPNVLNNPLVQMEAVSQETQQSAPEAAVVTGARARKQTRKSGQADPPSVHNAWNVRAAGAGAAGDADLSGIGRLIGDAASAGADAAGKPSNAPPRPVAAPPAAVEAPSVDGTPESGRGFTYVNVIKAVRTGAFTDLVKTQKNFADPPAAPTDAGELTPTRGVVSTPNP